MFSSKMVFELTTFVVTFCTSLTVLGTFRTIKLRMQNSCPNCAKTTNEQCLFERHIIVHHVTMKNMF